MSAYQETKIHGTRSFPYIVYPGVVPERLTGVGLHWHEEMEIIYVREGMVAVTVRNSEYILRPGDIILIHPQTIHSIRQYEEEHALYFNILFRLSVLESGAEDICRQKYLEPIYTRRRLMPEFVGREHPLNTAIAPIIEKLLVDPHHQRFHDELLIKSRLFELLYHVFPYCDQADKNSAYEDIVYEKLKASLRYIEQNFAEPISVERIAAISNYSDSHFSKLFRELTGESFTQYLKHYRLEKAANRILNEDTKISEIAVACGFSNLSYFSRSFYERFTVTPTEYRRLDRLRKQYRHQEMNKGDGT